MDIILHAKIILKQWELEVENKMEQTSLGGGGGGWRRVSEKLQGLRA